MYAGQNFTQIEPLETVVLSFDFANQLAATETVVSASFTIAVFSGTDSSVASRLIGTTAINGTVISQRVGTCLANTVYRVTGVANTSLNQILDLWAHLPCVQPN